MIKVVGLGWFMENAATRNMVACERGQASLQAYI